MDRLTDAVYRLTEFDLTPAQRDELLSRFATESGWRPSDRVAELPYTRDISSGHILVEYGLENAAVITFLSKGHQVEALSSGELAALLSVSYNNLVDWHFFPDRSGTAVINNRARRVVPRFVRGPSPSTTWKVDAFRELTREADEASLRPLDKALIDTITFWRSALHSDLGNPDDTSPLSMFFNAVIFLRAVEDDGRHRGTVRVDEQVFMGVLADDTDELSAKNVVETVMRRLNVDRLPISNLGGLDALNTLAPLSKETLWHVCRDFYRNRFTPYDYDFSLISKHALSKVYEQYTLALQEDVHRTQTKELFGKLPQAKRRTSAGIVYTPQFIARFFCRFIRERVTPPAFRELKFVDPACGSGIFLRTLLEMQMESAGDFHSGEVIKEAWSRFRGVDIDSSACDAARLSLSLLYLVTTGSVPDEQVTPIVNHEALSYFQTNGSREVGSFDAVLTNPPFVKWERLDPEVQTNIRAYLGRKAFGRVDGYIAHLMLGLSLLSEGAFGCFVLPHSVLISASAKKVRQYIAESFTVRLLADLSDISVFGDVGAYVVLLIVERQVAARPTRPDAIVVKARDAAGAALEDAVLGREVDIHQYSVSNVQQEYFDADTWRILNPRDMARLRRLQEHPRLDEFFEVREGAVSGGDYAFLASEEEIPSNERKVWARFVKDKDIGPYVLPKHTGKLMFMALDGTRKITEATLRNEYPRTWQHLTRYKDKLSSRKPVRQGHLEWWQPTRPRTWELWNTPKILVPHLMLRPRFALDGKGQWAVSRSPVLVPKDRGMSLDMLYYFLGLLNSGVVLWQLVVGSHKYGGGYLMLEPKSLIDIRVPSPVDARARTVESLSEHVEQLIVTKKSWPKDYEDKLEKLVLELYSVDHRWW